MSPVRLLVFLFISLAVHLLAFWPGMTDSNPAGRVTPHGVGLIARSAEQFLWRPVVPRSKPEPQVKADVANAQVTKPSPEQKPQNRPTTPEPVETVVSDTPVVAEKIFEENVVEPEEVPEPELQPDHRAPVEPLSAVASAESVESVDSEPANSFSDGVVQAEGLTGVDAVADSVGFQQALPRYELNPLPYPESARRRGQEGTVRLEVLVEEDGRVGELRLVDSSGHRVLDRAALHAVRRWRFKPATSYGCAVESRVVIPVDFVLHAGR